MNILTLPDRNTMTFHWSSHSSTFFLIRKTVISDQPPADSSV